MVDPRQVLDSPLLADLELNPASLAAPCIRWTVYWRGQAVPVLDTRLFFGLQAAGSAHSITDLAVAIGSLVHQLQIERGASALFLGSRGIFFARELADQRRASDAAIADLVGLVDPGPAPGRAFDRQLQQTFDRLAGLDLVRVAVGGLRADETDTIDCYSGIIDLLLGAVDLLGSLPPGVQVKRQTACYRALLNAKEKAGLERALLSLVFARGRFAEGQFNRFIQLVADQETYLNAFERHATPSQRAFYRQRLSGPVVDEAEHLRRRARSGPFAHLAPRAGLDTDPAYWFWKQSAKLDRLKEVEDRLANELGTQLDTLNRGENPCLLLAAAEAGGDIVGFVVDGLGTILLSPPAGICRAQGPLGTDGFIRRDGRLYLLDLPALHRRATTPPAAPAPELGALGRLRPPT